MMYIYIYIHVYVYTRTHPFPPLCAEGTWTALETIIYIYMYIYRFVLTHPPFFLCRGDVDGAMRWFETMKEFGIEPDLQCYNGLVRAYYY